MNMPKSVSLLIKVSSVHDLKINPIFKLNQISSAQNAGLTSQNSNLHMWNELLNLTNYVLIRNDINFIEKMQLSCH